MKHCLSAMIRYGVFLILLLLTFGCRKDLCYDHELHSASVKTVVAADWEQEWERVYDFDWEQNWNVLWGREYDELRPDIAEGIRALVYSAGGGFSENNLSAEGGRLPMKEGVYSLLFYNNDTEYILFNDLTTSASASATTRTRTRGGFKELHAGERTVSPPDMLYGAYVKEHFAERTLESIELPVIMRPLTYTYLIRYEFKKGAQYVALARGALAGMAESVYLDGPGGGILNGYRHFPGRGPESAVLHGDGGRHRVILHRGLRGGHKLPPGRPGEGGHLRRAVSGCPGQAVHLHCRGPGGSRDRQRGHFHAFLGHRGDWMAGRGGVFLLR